MQREGGTPRWSLIIAAIALFFLSAVAAGAAVAFLPDWTALVVVIVSGYVLWNLMERARN